MRLFFINAMGSENASNIGDMEHILARFTPKVYAAIIN